MMNSNAAIAVAAAVAVGTIFTGGGKDTKEKNEHIINRDHERSRWSRFFRLMPKAEADAKIRRSAKICCPSTSCHFATYFYSHLHQNGGRSRGARLAVR